jgi:hypothetical protein
MAAGQNRAAGLTDQGNMALWSGQVNANAALTRGQNALIGADYAVKGADAAYEGSLLSAGGQALSGVYKYGDPIYKWARSGSGGGGYGTTDYSAFNNGY